MKLRILLAAFVFSVVILFAFRLREEKQKTTFNLAAYKKKTVIRCTADWNSLKGWLEESDIPPMPGAGLYRWKISTTSDSAQFYFNQGINMYYGFHIIEAMASFKKAARFDPNCAMIYWAQALSYGPNINDYGYRASPEALLSLNQAKAYNANATVFEKALIQAMSVRYTSDSTDVTRAQLNIAYTAEMKKVMEAFPTMTDAVVLYADAMMLEHPWELWNNNGTPKQWTPAIRTVLEKALQQNPMHPGANHYYIHVMEASPYASLALPSASRLGKTNPGLSHLVHMPSHIYLRTGYYDQGVIVNDRAVNSYQKSIALFAPVTGADFLYSIHNLHMKANNAMMTGNAKVSAEAALETQNSIPKDYLSMPAPLGNLVQYIYHTPVLAKVRFGKWQSLLEMQQPPVAEVFSNVMYHFGRGMALANTGNVGEAKQQLLSLQLLLKDSSLAIPYSPFSPAVDGGIVAEQLLAGTIALKENRLKEAVLHFLVASSREESMVYNEPRDWLLNPKHYLGYALLLVKDGKQAESVFRKDLKNNMENGWALYGCYQALLLQGKKTEAAQLLVRFKKAFAKADIVLKAPVVE